jgi:hypothetical protein
MSFVSRRILQSSANNTPAQGAGIPVWAGGEQATLIWVVTAYNTFDAVIDAGIYDINIWGAGGGGQTNADGWSIPSPGGGGGAIFYTLTALSPTNFTAVVGEKGGRPRGNSTLGTGGIAGAGGRGYGKGGDGAASSTLLGSGGGGSSSFLTSGITLIAAGGGGAKPIRNTDCGVPPTSAATAGGTGSGAGGFGSGAGSAGSNGINGGGGGSGSSNNANPNICGPFGFAGGSSGSGGMGGSNVGGTSYSGSGRTPGNITNANYTTYLSNVSAGYGGMAGGSSLSGSDGFNGAFIIERKVNTVLLLRGDTQTDSSSYNVPITFRSGADISTLYKKYGTGSIFIPTTSQAMVSAVNTNNFTLSTSWTVEAWVYPLQYNSYSHIVCRWFTATVNSDWSMGIDSAGRLCGGTWGGGITSGIARGGGVVPLSSWSHVAISWDGNTKRHFINGTQVWSDTTFNSITAINSNQILSIGCEGPNFLGNNPYNGYIDNLRVVKNTALYLKDFTPPSN